MRVRSASRAVSPRGRRRCACGAADAVPVRAQRRLTERANERHCERLALDGDGGAGRDRLNLVHVRRGATRGPHVGRGQQRQQRNNAEAGDAHRRVLRGWRIHSIQSRTPSERGSNSCTKPRLAFLYYVAARATGARAGRGRAGPENGRGSAHKCTRAQRLGCSLLLLVLSSRGGCRRRSPGSRRRRSAAAAPTRGAPPSRARQRCC